MPPSIKSLRRSVVAGGAVLLLVVAAFLTVARLRGHGFHLDLPGRLGVDISQTANEFTYSQSQKGHTLFTIHASKLVQYKGNQAELHDVTITLYGPEGSGRTDKIYGSDFIYDRKQGLARAVGAVKLDFASPEVKAGSSGSQIASGHAAGPAAGEPGSADAGAIHVTTSGLSFDQKTGQASTDQRVDFVLTRASGSAVGATYDAKSGVLVLDHQVALSTAGGVAGGGTQSAQGTTVHADHAQLLRDTRQAFLIKADTTYGEQHSSSDAATVKFRQDGGAEQIDARGHVHLTTGDGGEVHCSSALIDLDEQSQPRTANLDGGVTYFSDQGGQTMQGNAVAGTLTFASVAPPGSAAAAGPGRAAASRGRATIELHHAQFRNAVTFVLQQQALKGDANGSSTRAVRASKLDVEFAPGAGNKTEARRALAVGDAAFTLHDVPSKGAATVSAIHGDQLLATLANGRDLRELDGRGNTSIMDTAPDGAVNTSTGDALHVTFTARGAPATARANSSGNPGHGNPAQVDVATQQGNVSMTQMPAIETPAGPGTAASPPGGKADAPSPLHATAARAEYHAVDQVLHLTGDSHLRNDTVELSADRVDYHRDTGDAVAMGNVKSTYAQRAGQKAAAPTLGGDGPVHVVADHASMTRSSTVSVFYGSSSAPARMWQGADAVAAPVIELGREQQSLDAHGNAGDGLAMVHATLGAKTEKAGSTTAGAGPQTGSRPTGAVTRLTAGTLHYADKDRRADLRGFVVAEQPSGVVHADDAQVYLMPAGGPSGLDHLVASGHVIVMQPGRRGTGERLVYTAADQRYVLTGNAQQPPRVTDTAKGTTTGAALIFKGADDSVEVSSQIPGQGLPDKATAANPASGYQARTVTDTHTPK